MGTSYAAEKSHYLTVTALAAAPTTATAAGALDALNWSPRAKLSRGLGISAAVGWEVSPSLRTEIEVGHRTTEYLSLNPSTLRDGDATIEIGATPLDGQMQTTALTLNAIWMMGSAALRPYLGAGVGPGQHYVDLKRVTVRSQSMSYRTFGVHGYRFVGVGQAMGGLTLQINESIDRVQGLRHYARGGRYPRVGISDAQRRCGAHGPALNHRLPPRKCCIGRPTLTRQAKFGEVSMDGPSALASACQKIDIYLNPKNKWRFKIAKNFHVR